MRIWKLATLAILAVALAAPGVSLAKNKHGIGKGGVPELRDQIYDRFEEVEDYIAELEKRVTELEGTVAELGDRLADVEDLTDADLDGFNEEQGDCDDANAAANPGATEDPTTNFDDDCDGLINEAV